MSVHSNYMPRLADEGVVLQDGLAFRESADRSGELVAVTLAGRLRCANHVAIRVDKKLAVRRGMANRVEVKTRFYQYHAWVRQSRGQPRRNLLRYGNAHRDDLHVHVVDTNGPEVERISLPLEELPSLDGFIRHAVDLGRIV